MGSCFHCSGFVNLGKRLISMCKVAVMKQAEISNPRNCIFDLVPFLFKCGWYDFAMATAQENPANSISWSTLNWYSLNSSKSEEKGCRWWSCHRWANDDLSHKERYTKSGSINRTKCMRYRYFGLPPGPAIAVNSWQSSIGAWTVSEYLNEEVRRWREARLDRERTKGDAFWRR